MKKYIKQISLLALFAAFASCTDNSAEDGMMPEAAGRTVLKTTSISRLDTNVEIPLALALRDGVTVTGVEVYHNIANTGAPIKLGEHVGTATVTDGGTKATFNSSGLGDFSKFPVRQTDGSLVITTRPTGTMPLAFVTTFSDGTTLNTTATLTVAKGIVWKVLDDDGEPTVTSSTSGISEIMDQDPAQHTIYYAIVKKAATSIASVTLEIKKNGTSLGVEEVDMVKGSRDVSKDVADLGLVIGDKITYVYTVTSSTGQKDAITSTIEIVTQNFGDSASGSIGQELTMNKFNLATGTTLTDESTKGEIVFTPSFGFAKEGTTKIDFVQNSGLAYDADLFEAETAYAAGTKVTSVTGLEIDDVVLYKVIRYDADLEANVTTYGLLKVTDKIVNTSAKIETFKFTYKEGEIVR